MIYWTGIVQLTALQKKKTTKNQQTPKAKIQMPHQIFNKITYHTLGQKSNHLYPYLSQRRHFWRRTPKIKRRRFKDSFECTLCKDTDNGLQHALISGGITT